MLLRIVLMALGSIVLFGCGGRDCSKIAEDLNKEAPASELTKCAQDQECICAYQKKVVDFWEKAAKDCSDDATKKSIDTAINTANPAYGGKTLKEYVNSGCKQSEKAAAI